MRPICHKCGRFFKPKTNGYYFIESMPVIGNPRPGNVEPEKWKPYKLWVGDLYECPDCGVQIISGFGRSHVAEHYEPNFDDWVSRTGAQFRVNDC